MSLIVGLEHQPNFPREDLSETNAEFLSLLLQNYNFVEGGHVASESISLIYRLGHPTIVRSTGAIYEEPGQLRAIDHGVKLFESMSSMVTTPPERIGQFAVEHTAVQLIQIKTDEELRDYSIDTMINMQQQVPIAAETIRLASERTNKHLTDYAVLGAAMARQFEIDCVDAEEA